MANSYQDMPNRRIPWDGNGSVVLGDFQGEGGAGSLKVRGVLPATATITEHTQAEREDVNSDSDGTLIGGATPAAKTSFLIQYILFPEKHDIDGYYWNLAYGSDDPHQMLSTSGDTTSGPDGTWSALGTEIVTGGGTTVNSDYRKNIQPAVASDVVGVLMQSGFYPGVFGSFLAHRAVHLYGAIASGETPDRLLFLNYEASDAEFVKPLDYGNVGRGQEIITRMTIKNNSSTLDANTVQITCEDLYLGDTMFTYSTDGINDQATKALGTIDAGETATVYVHMNIPDAQPVDLFDVRSSLTVASWS